MNARLENAQPEGARLVDARLVDARLVDAQWPASRVGEALRALANASGFPVRAVDLPVVPEERSPAGAELPGWIERNAASLGLEAEPVFALYSDVERLVRAGGPILLALPPSALADGRRDGFLAVLKVRRRGALLAAPDGTIHDVPLRAVENALVGSAEAHVVAEVAGVLKNAGIPPARESRVRKALQEERLANVRIEAGWIVRSIPGGDFWAQLAQLHVGRRIAQVGLGHAVQYTLLLLGWWLVGRGALDGRLDRGWLLAWALVLLTTVPMQLFVTWAQGSLAIDGGTLLKARLLAGALRLDPETIKKSGAGQLLGRVIESQAVESLALGGGVLGLLAFAELGIAGVVLSYGAGSALEVPFLIGWCAIAIGTTWRYLGHRRAWTDARIALTNDLVERMLGHRTRLAQQRRATWHEAEDPSLERYHEVSRRLDRGGVRLISMLPRGWLVLGLVGLSGSFVLRQEPAPRLAVALGGILLAYRALHKLTLGLASLAGALIAWREVSPLFRAAATIETPPPPDLVVPRAPHESAHPILEASELRFRYRGRAELVLRGASLDIRAGDRILLEGPSGGGKSTLGSLLAGQRDPESGLLLLGGLDRGTLGFDAWRRHVASAPQYHENHVLSATFAFNLLMGRDWPASREDAAEAEAVCHELGLGPLLARMPGGLEQVVGETGWQLSHGEKSRLYIARALLQHADVMVLDESFAALDPETLRRALTCVLARANALLVVAHP